jgi:hypothetical protein
MMNTEQTRPQLNKHIIPLISANGKLEDISDMIRYIKNGDLTFMLKDGFSIEYLFSMNNKKNSDGTLLRFVYQVEGLYSSNGYLGTVFINPDGRMCYRKSSKSPRAPYLHGLLTRFISSLNMKKMPDVVFAPADLSDFFMLM